MVEPVKEMDGVEPGEGGPPEGAGIPFSGAGTSAPNLPIRR